MEIAGLYISLFLFVCSSVKQDSVREAPCFTWPFFSYDYACMVCS